MNLPFMRRMNAVSMPFGFLQMFAGDGGAGGGGDPVTYTEEQYQAKLREGTSAAVEKAIKERFGDLAGMDLKVVKEAVDFKRKADEEAAAAAAKAKGGKVEEKPLSAEDVEKLLKERLEAGNKEQAEKTFQRLLRADVKVYAAELGFADFEDAFKLADLSKVKEAESGDLEGVKEALEALAKAKPHLLKQKPAGGRVGATIPNGSAGGSSKEHKEAIIKQAQSRGNIQPQTVYDPWAKK